MYYGYSRQCNSCTATAIKVKKMAFLQPKVMIRYQLMDDTGYLWPETRKIM